MSRSTFAENALTPSRFPSLRSVSKGCINPVRTGIISLRRASSANSVAFCFTALHFASLHGLHHCLRLFHRRAEVSFRDDLFAALWQEVSQAMHECHLFPLHPLSAFLSRAFLLLSTMAGVCVQSAYVILCTLHTHDYYW